MSTKIYDAYEWYGGSLDKLLSKLRRIRKRIFDLGVEQCLKTVNPSTFSYVDYYETLKKAIRRGEWDYFDKEKDLIVPNLQSSAVVYIHKDRIFVQFFGLPRDFRFDKKGLRDFHYQNQADQDPRISEKNWKDREKTWDEIFKTEDRPSHAGLCFEFISESDCPHVSSAMFDKMHGHKLWDGLKDDCLFCIERRKAVEQKEKTAA